MPEAWGEGTEEKQEGPRREDTNRKSQEVGGQERCGHTRGSEIESRKAALDCDHVILLR